MKRQAEMTSATGSRFEANRANQLNRGAAAALAGLPESAFRQNQRCPASRHSLQLAGTHGKHYAGITGQEAE